MSIRLPSFSEIQQVARTRGRNSEAPQLWDGLVGAWPMQEGAGDTIYDVSGNRAHGTLYNTPTWTATDRGRAIQFDGSTVLRAISGQQSAISNLTADR